MILEVRNLKKYFPIEHGIFRAACGFRRALDGVSFCLEENGVLGIVGESGCGKTTLAKLILRLLAPTDGEVNFGPTITNFRKDIGIVFQDPLLSLDPRMRIKNILLEPLLINRLKNSSSGRIEYLLGIVGLKSDILRRYPSELSGGQRQRVCLARSLAPQPKLLVLDEPLSSLDLIIQKQLLRLMLELKNELGMSYIFISHNIAVVKNISTSVIVMREGKIVEQGKTESVFLNPASEYTKKLLEAAA